MKPLNLKQLLLFILRFYEGNWIIIDFIEGRSRRNKLCFPLSRWLNHSVLLIQLTSQQTGSQKNQALFICPYLCFMLSCFVMNLIQIQFGSFKRLLPHLSHVGICTCICKARLIDILIDVTFSTTVLPSIIQDFLLLQMCINVYILSLSVCSLMFIVSSFCHHGSCVWKVASEYSC